MLLWQAVALAAVLAALGAGLALATDRPGGPRRAHGVRRGDAGAAGHRAGRRPAPAAAATSSAPSCGRSDAGTASRSTWSGAGSRTGECAVLEHDVPVAYCLPGMGGSRIVMSSGPLGRLAPDGAGGGAAPRARPPARPPRPGPRGVHGAAPGVPARGGLSGAALDEVALLVEVLADRAAVRAGPARALGRALLAMAEGRLPEGALGLAAGSAWPTRVELLARPRRPPRPGGSRSWSWRSACSRCRRSSWSCPGWPTWAEPADTLAVKRDAGVTIA